MTAGDLGPELERLPGVLAATVFDDRARGPRVYLATGPTADAGALRQVVLALLADRGVAGDPDRVHVATPPVTGTAAALPRFTLDGLDVHRTDGWVECAARLRSRGRIVTGTGREPDTAPGRARAAARAVLQAVESLDPDLRLGLHGSRVADLFGYDAVVVIVEAVAGRAHGHLPGTALVDRSVEEAAAMATTTALRSWSP